MKPIFKSLNFLDLIIAIVTAIITAINFILFNLSIWIFLIG